MPDHSNSTLYCLFRPPVANLLKTFCFSWLQVLEGVVVEEGQRVEAQELEGGVDSATSGTTGSAVPRWSDGDGVITEGGHTSVSL